MIKTRCASYCVNGISEGCKRCVIGRKMVLFVTGKCSRNCVYCPLSKLRKNSNKVWANEKECKNLREVIEEVKESNANSCSITGGDPLINLKRTLKFARGLKKEFKKFHIHIYLSTKLVNEKNLEQLSPFIDEVRFHPEFLSDPTKFEEDIKKISLAKKFWKSKNIGVEMPIFPDRKKEILAFIEKISPHIHFVNLNELEIGDTNFNFIISKYKLDKQCYTVNRSLDAGIWIIKNLEKKKTKLKVHLCSAETKNWYQYKNRLKNHKIMKYGKKTKEGTVIYFVSEDNLRKERGVDYDEKKKRYILNSRAVKKLIQKYKILKIEEYPTYDRDEIEVEELK